MRAFEFHAGEIVYPIQPNVMIVDLDYVVTLKATQAYEGDTLHPLWTVSFSDGSHVSMTKAAFDRILLAWKGK